MKSFGVRLAAGLVTIVFGAYAAALAQKDKQNGTSSWTAEAPSIGQPAAPIAGIAEEQWLSEPDEQRRQFAQASFTENRDVHDDVFAASNVAMVQHTEEVPQDDYGYDAADSGFAPPSAPAALGSPQPEMEWAMPPDAGQDPGQYAGQDPGQYDVAAEMSYDAADVRTERSLSMTFPSEAPGEPAPAPAMSQPAAPMPEFSISEMPDVQYYEAEQEPAPQPMAQDNLLRSAPAGDMMRDAMPRDAMPPAPPAEAYAAPAPITYAPATAYPGNAYNADQQGGYPATNNPPPRMASLADVPTGMRAEPSYPAAAPNSGAFQGYAPEPGYQPQALPQPASAIEMDSKLLVDLPGDRRLEGIQSPSIVIHKRAPAQVTVGKPATFVIQVQNVGAVEADVTVHDRVPQGTRLIDASPAPVQQGDVLMWQLGVMQAGAEQTVTMQLVPETEGEIGSVARVTFEAAASVRTMSTRPELKIVQRAPEKVLIGQQLEIELEVSNPGSGTAGNVSLQEDVPDGLEHPKGRQLDNLIGNLAPGEVRTQVLRLKAVSPGLVQNTIRLVSEDGLTAEHSINVEVIAPKIEVALSAPSLRYLERQVACQLEIMNTGTADANNVEVSVQLDRGFTFVSTDYEGQYDPSRHSVFWSLAQLPPGGRGSVPLTLLAVESGDRIITVDARADLGIAAKNERTIRVEGLAELSFQIINPGGPIELGAESSYEITINNSGSKPDTNVRLELYLPPGLELIAADGDAGTDGRGLVAFQPRAQLAPGAEMKYRVRVRGVAAGTHLVKAVVVSDQATKPVSKEESTLVYADQ
ncbi:Large cysteine-rich periplasmic protein OmcB precursor [Rubripirellula tenax]|uniref:Large cysteine-rich periplasmic protein OmcB n=1 Tax=Rubripirellula tenax TaxID=2528015 RepID=A0A5C6EBV6_9BACT|nr:DUF11 domain-containing protein [Rubripirellula tenax]TWU46210.1 Large cysteine-rich periplasmic protein OmcB precursor [Rubripirellula tenax]